MYGIGQKSWGEIVREWGEGCFKVQGIESGEKGRRENMDVGNLRRR